ncbi:NDR1/HIN1-like protein 1 [Bidens hawaiensis]|uniref:NDR1/HIN1-like protein 1 n=1 Tax=Bidens hawaiensis TaxID=980011 RepID=UPI0040495D64
MAEKIHLNTDHTTGNPKFPPTKSQLRPLYHPQALRTHRNRNHNRSRCCSCCLWLTFLLILILTIAAAACGVFYVMYSPHPPSFTVSSIKVSRFDITSGTSDNEINTRFNFTLTARNPNDDVTFLFDSVSVKAVSKEVEIGDGRMPAFVLDEKNVTWLRAVVVGNGRVVDDDSEVKLDLKKKRLVMVSVEFDTKVKLKIGRMETKKVKIRVVCKGIRFAPHGGKGVVAADTSDVKCDVDVRTKISRWTI